MFGYPQANPAAKVVGLAVESRSGKRKCYSLRIVRWVERCIGFAKRPNTMLNPARFARWTPNRYALGCRLA